MWKNTHTHTHTHSLGDRLTGSDSRKGYEHKHMFLFTALPFQGSSRLLLRSLFTSRMARHSDALSPAYIDALRLLDTLQSNAATLHMVSQRPELNNVTLMKMEQYLHRLGYTAEQLNTLNVIHIAGTKGKGSTAAFTESLLRYTATTKGRQIKTGLFTSPHLIDVEERIRINGAPLSKEAFSGYFFEVWDRFQRTKDQPPSSLPGYFAFLTCMAFHVFLQEKIDVLVCEVGMGGRFDPTNVVPRPLVTGITLLDLDHMAVLGPTLEAIAEQKAGIMKSRVPCFTVVQRAEGMAVLQRVAHDVGAAGLECAEPAESRALGLAGAHQRANAGLALRLAQVAVPDIDARGLSVARWPGRCQRVLRDGVTYFLDGAHTAESVRACVDWVMPQLDPHTRRVLVFACTHGRDPQPLLSLLAPLDFAETRHAALDAYAAPGAVDLSHVLDGLRPGDQCLVTGSLYLVGHVLKKLGEPA